MYIFQLVEDRRNKLDQKNQKMYLMSNADNWYRLWTPTEKRITSARNVVIDESLNFSENTNWVEIMKNEGLASNKDGDSDKNDESDSDCEGNHTHRNEQGNHDIYNNVERHKRQIIIINIIIIYWYQETQMFIIENY